MKRIFLIAFIAFIANILLVGESFSQGWDQRVSWSFKVEKIDDNHAYIVATAKLVEGWHVFSVNHDPMKADFTGYPTTFKFKETADYKLIGKLQDGGKPKTHVDELGTSLYFEHSGIFKQKIEVLSSKKFDVAFEYSFQICDENGCLFPPDQEAKVSLSGYTPGNATDKPVAQDLKITGDQAKDEEGNDYVRHQDKWIKVPAGNSILFYKKYLELGGKYEE